MAQSDDIEQYQATVSLDTLVEEILDKYLDSDERNNPLSWSDIQQVLEKYENKHYID